jgi:hypothetical protein
MEAKMRKSIVSVFSLVIFVSFFSSCIIAVVDYSDQAKIFPKSEYHKTVYFNSGGALSLDNYNGDIEIRGWERKEVEVFAERMIPRPYEKKIYLLGTIDYKPKIHFDKYKDFIKIKTRYTGEEKEASAVDYYLNAPNFTNLKDIKNRKGNIFISDLTGEAVIDLVNGEIEVENFSGSLSASVRNGFVRASFYDLRAEDEVKITNREGDIEIYLPQDAEAQLEASAPNGMIFSDFDLDQQLPADNVSAQLGGGGALISLHALNGDIKIKIY